MEEPEAKSCEKAAASCNISQLPSKHLAEEIKLNSRREEKGSKVTEFAVNTQIMKTIKSSESKKW